MIGGAAAGGGSTVVAVGDGRRPAGPQRSGRGGPARRRGPLAVALAVAPPTTAVRDTREAGRRREVCAGEAEPLHAEPMAVMGERHRVQPALTQQVAYLQERLLALQRPPTRVGRRCALRRRRRLTPSGPLRPPPVMVLELAPTASRGSSGMAETRTLDAGD